MKYCDHKSLYIYGIYLLKMFVILFESTQTKTSTKSNVIWETFAVKKFCTRQKVPKRKEQNILDLRSQQFNAKQLS